MGLIDVKKRNLLSAKNKFKKLLIIDKKKYEAYLNLSNVYSIEGDNVKAYSVLENYLKNIQENVEIINALAINLLHQQKIKELEAHINKYISTYENHILYYLKGYILNKADEISKSEFFFKKSIDINSSFWNSYDFLFKQYDKQSRMNSFKFLINKAEKNFNNNVRFYYYKCLYLFRKKEYENSLKILEDKEIVKQFISQKNDIQLADYYDLLSKTYEKLGFCSDSYNAAIKRNEIILGFKENAKYNKKVILNTITIYKKFYNKKNNPKPHISNNGINHNNLVFLIGFPRSGTTLLDTILRSHSKTLVLEEKPFLLNVRHEFFKKNQLVDILKINQEKIIKLQKQYFDSFDYKSEKLVIDKYPLNLVELGFIRTLFPDSKIILALRHPLDCIISCVLTAFKMNDGMVNFENIQTTSYFYNECFELLFKYIKFYNIKYHEVKYENVVVNFKYEINKLLNFLNLDYEEGINNFHKTAMQREKINTPSYAQVTQPIYSNSINRHKKFIEIKNIKVDINQWIKRFSY